MKILVGTIRDSANAFMENIIKKLIDNGHEIVIYDAKNDKSSLWMFEKMGIEIRAYDQLFKDDLSEFDCAFVPSAGVGHFSMLKKYIFSFSSFIPHLEMNIAPSEFVFTVGRMGDSYDGGFAYMPVGASKNDTDVAEVEGESKRILFVDSGHFPFSKTGKMQVAGMLLEICEKYPDYEICVKPRWLPDKQGKHMTHYNRIHIYDCLKELAERLPENLNLLEENKNLQELIDSSSCVITMCSTAFLDVPLRKKGLVVVKGFESDDVSTLRKRATDIVYEAAEGSGCVVDYKDVCSYLPHGLKFKRGYIKNFYEYLTGASEKVVKVVEYVYEKYLKKGIYPEPKEYSYRGFFSLPIKDSGKTLTEIIKQRYYEVGKHAQYLLHTGINDWTDFYDVVKELSNEAVFSRDGREEFRELCKTERDKFIVKNESFLRSNKVDRHYFYGALYSLGRYDELLKLLETEDEHPSLNYYCGLILFDKGSDTRDAGAGYLVKYFNEIKDRDYRLYTEEYIKYKKECYERLYKYYLEKGDHERMFHVLLYYMDEEYYSPQRVRSWVKK